jgi:hypothetical protein
MRAPVLSCFVAALVGPSLAWAQQAAPTGQAAPAAPVYTQAAPTAPQPPVAQPQSPQPPAPPAVAPQAPEQYPQPPAPAQYPQQTQPPPQAAPAQYPQPPAPPPYPPAPPVYTEPPAPPPPAEYAPAPSHRGRHRRERGYVSGQPLPPGMRPPLRYRYIEGTPLPEGYHIEERANRGLVGGGAALIAVPYFIGALGALSVQGDGNSGYLAIPILGPWLTLGNRESSCGEIGEPSPGGFDCFMDQAGSGLLITSGVMQALGTGMIVLGLVNTREYAVADYATVRFTPVATPSSGGLVVSGTL